MENRPHLFTESRARTEVSEEMRLCIDNCLECSRNCTELIPHCLSLGGAHAEKEHITLLSTCALICNTSAKLMMLDSNFHHDLCKICSEVCNQCADDCDAVGGADERMIDVANICRKCADSCDRMASH
jgi:hypothetical protein